MNELLARSKKLSPAQIKSASDNVKANLIDALLKVSAELASSPDLGSITQLAKLTDTAHKLFGWPNSKPVDLNASNSALPANIAINLPLIRTTPEQLRAKAREIAKEVKQSAAN